MFAYVHSPAPSPLPTPSSPFLMSGKKGGAGERRPPSQANDNASDSDDCLVVEVEEKKTPTQMKTANWPLWDDDQFSRQLMAVPCKGAVIRVPVGALHGRPMVRAVSGGDQGPLPEEELLLQMFSAAPPELMVFFGCWAQLRLICHGHAPWATHPLLFHRLAGAVLRNRSFLYDVLHAKWSVPFEGICRVLVWALGGVEGRKVEMLSDERIEDVLHAITNDQMTEQHLQDGIYELLDPTAQPSPPRVLPPPRPPPVLFKAADGARQLLAFTERITWHPHNIAEYSPQLWPSDCSHCWRRRAPRQFEWQRCREWR